MAVRFILKDNIQIIDININRDNVYGLINSSRNNFITVSENNIKYSINISNILYFVEI
jgi:pantothenate synthetase